MTKITTCFTIFLLLSFSFVSGAQQAAEKMPVKINEKGVHQAFPERMPGTFDPVKYQQKQEATNNWLISESAPLSADAIVTIHVTDSEIAEIDEYNRRNNGEGIARKLRIGLVKAVGLTVDLSGITLESLSTTGRFLANGMMRTASGGAAVWTTALESEKARGLRVHFTDVNLPENAALYVYNMNGEAFGPYTGKGPNKTGEFWSHTVIGTTAFVQLHVSGPVSPEALQSTRFAIRDIGFLGDKFLLALRGEPRTPKEVPDQPMEHCPENAWCVEDASCFDSGDWAAIDDAKHGTACIMWPYKSGIYACSGGLVADTDPKTFIPYFLTANHCINNPTDASNLECYWRYWTASCHAPCYWPAGVVPRTLGAEILSSSTLSDWSFLHLSEDPPEGSVLMGWTTETVHNLPGYELYRISHPLASPQAYSMHVVDPDSPQCTGRERPYWIYSTDIIGATENGSSGSPVFNVDGQIVGQLTGSCGYHLEDPCDSKQNWTTDGTFAKYYHRILVWIDPIYAPTSLNARGIGCNEIRLTWEDMSYNEDRFSIERSEDGVIFDEIAVVDADNTSFTDTDLEQETIYWYRVKACQGDRCSEYSNVDSANTYGPPSPPKLAAEQTGEHEIKLWWKHQNLSITITTFLANVRGFHVYRASSPPFVISPPFERIATLRPGASKFVDQRIVPGRTYYYKVCAFNKCGESCSKIVQVEVQ